MKLQDRVDKDFRQIQTTANAMFQVAARGVGAKIEDAFRDIIGSVTLLLSNYEKPDFVTLNSTGTFKRLETLIETRLNHLATDICEYWSEKRVNFDLLARLATTFISRKSSPPWVTAKLDLASQAKEGDFDPRKGHIHFYMQRLADKIMQEIKQGTLNEESVMQIVARIKIKKTRRESEHREQSQKLKMKNNSEPIENIEVQDGVFTMDDVERFNDELDAANSWQYRSTKPWFSDSLKRNNAFLRQLEQTLMYDATTLLHNNLLEIGPKEAGIEDFQWIAAKSEKNCEYCGNRHRMLMKDIKKEIKDKYRDQAPPLHPHCRCELVPKLSDKWVKSAATKAGLTWNANDGLTYKADSREKQYGIRDMDFDEFMDAFLGER